MDKQAFPVKGRYVVAAWLIPVMYLPGFGYVYHLLGEDPEWYWYDILYYYCSHTLIAIVLAALILIHGIKWRRMLARPDGTDYLPAFRLTAFLFIFSIAAAYALFYPLSFTHPEFVKLWYIEIPSSIYSSEGRYPFIPNALSAISLVVLAPVLEEVAFRGLLLHRWSRKWGVNRAILFSSLLFGIVHPDPVGATAFGIAMCVLYLRTHTLVVPIVCHALTNLAALTLEAGSFLLLGPEYVYTLEDFQDGLIIGLACAVIAITMAQMYLNSDRSRQVWQLPDIA